MPNPAYVVIKVLHIGGHEVIDRGTYSRRELGDMWVDKMIKHGSVEVDNFTPPTFVSKVVGKVAPTKKKGR